MTTVPLLRRVTVLGDHSESRAESNQLLAEYRNTPAYVLLGEPGSGKTTAFKMECKADPEPSELVTTRDFLELDLDRHKEWQGKTLFIDGLDEMRTAAGNWRTPLGSIRNRLEHLGQPRFRLSCRAGEWLGDDDAAALRRLGLYSELAVLRLDPLDEEEIRALLEGHVGPTRAGEFLSYAQENGLYGLLQHPLNVELLLKAGIGNGRISGRRGLFESACESMSQEENQAHRAARRGRPYRSETMLLNAIGRLCALSLLTDTPGWSVDPVEPTRGYPSIREIENADVGGSPEELDGALRSRLFRMTSDCRFEPIHRQVAEFLAGRFLGEQMDERNLSPTRLRALMASDDGVVTPSLRGLAAWIAVYSPRARSGLVRDDPIGVAIYGDASEFGPEDQKQLISSLRDRAAEIDVWTWPGFALPSLATPGALPIVRDIINALERDDATQGLALLALLAVAQLPGSSIPQDLREPLLQVARDRQWQVGVRAAAMKAWVASVSQDERHMGEAMKFLEEIRAGAIRDPQASLTGLLLGYLYPKHVRPDQLWNYATPLRPDPPSMDHVGFWKNKLPRLSEEAGCLKDVLDSITRRSRNPQHRIGDSAIQRGIVKTFACALERHGERIETGRLYEWFAVVLRWIPSKNEHDALVRMWRGLGTTAAPENDRARIDDWLRDHPDTQKALISELIHRNEDHEIIFPRDAHRTGSLTIDAVLAGTPVADFALWFLEQAVSVSESRPQLACHLLSRTVVGTGTTAELPDHLRMPWEELPDRLRMAWEKEAGATGVSHAGHATKGLTLDEVRVRTTGHQSLEECLDSLLAPPPQPRLEHPLVQKRARRRREWIDSVREYGDALGRGEGPPSLLHEVAKAYLGINRSINGNTPEERLSDLFLGDDELRDTAQRGIQRIALNPDLPTVEDLIQLEEDGKTSYFVLPLLASMEERQKMPSGSRARLQGEDLQRAVAYYFLASDFGGSDPAWYRRALRSDAKDVAEAFVGVYRSRIRAKAGVDQHVRALTRDRDHADVARIAVPRLLRFFPAKATTDQIFNLDYLIPAALEHSDRDELASVVHRKLESARLRIGQRVRWLAAGMLLGDPKHGAQLGRFLAKGSDVRLTELAAFLRQLPALSTRIRSLSAENLGMLVQRLGGYFAPHSGGGSGHISHGAAEAIQTGGIIREALDALSRLPSPRATELMQALADDDDLAAWRRDINKARDSQRIARLDAEFVPPTILDVLCVLEAGRPASAADLAALVADQVVAIGERVRDGDANMWRQFWNEGKRGVPDSPKTEPSCRDALLSALRPNLPIGVRVDKEASHAGDRKADLQASFRDLAVPVETKMSSSRDLWTAIGTQLIPRYTRDPRSGGHGVYIVFWHGLDYARRPTPSGTPPRTPRELQERLAQLLTTDVERKVRVIVLDVSQP